MADKTYVEVAKVNVKEIFDNKFKSKVQTDLTDGMNDAVDKSSKLTTKEPKDKKTEGFYIAGSVAVTLENGVLAFKLNTALASWPGKSIFGNATTSYGESIDDPDNVTDKDIDTVLAKLLKKFADNVVKALERQAG